MSLSLDDSLAEFVRVYSKLNGCYDKLNGTIRQVEDAIREVGLGIAVWLNEDIAMPRPAEDDSFVFQIGWTKVNDDWGIHVKEYDFPSRLLESSLAIRIAAYPILSHLVDEMIGRGRRGSSCVRVLF